MSITTLVMDVGNPERPEETRPIEFTVDSGAIPSVIPAEVLSDLGIEPIGHHEVRLADGSRITRKKRIAFFRYRGGRGW